MDKYTETFQTWNKIASLYQEKLANLDLYNDSYDFFCNLLTKEKSKLLEIGCGPGNISKYISSKIPNLDIFGIDIAPNMIEIAKTNNQNAKFKVMDCREINTLDEKYDGIICGFCLPYLSQEETSKILKDSFNLLNENGLLYLSFVEGDPNKSDFKVTGSGDRVYFYFHNIDDISKKLIENGFETINLFKINFKDIDIHTVLVAKKK